MAFNYLFRIWIVHAASDPVTFSCVRHVLGPCSECLPALPATTGQQVTPPEGRSHWMKGRKRMKFRNGPPDVLRRLYRDFWSHLNCRQAQFCDRPRATRDAWTWHRARVKVQQLTLFLKNHWRAYFNEKKSKLSRNGWGTFVKRNGENKVLDNNNMKVRKLQERLLQYI